MYQTNSFDDVVDTVFVINQNFLILFKLETKLKSNVQDIVIYRNIPFLK